MDDDTLIYLSSFYETRTDGRRWAWYLSPMADDAKHSEPAEHEGVFRFESHEAARAFAQGWIYRNRPELMTAARNEAFLARQYSAKK